MSLTIKQTNSFMKVVKKLPKQQKKELDGAIRKLIADPMLGGHKKGDLGFIRAYKFKMSKQETLLGYSYDDECLLLTLMSLGSHENFYRDLKRIIN